MQITEQPSFYNHLEKKSVREILEDINQEDQKVALAVQKAIPQIEEPKLSVHGVLIKPKYALFLYHSH